MNDLSKKPTGPGRNSQKNNEPQKDRFSLFTPLESVIFLL